MVGCTSNKSSVEDTCIYGIQPASTVSVTCDVPYENEKIKWVPLYKEGIN